MPYEHDFSGRRMSELPANWPSIRRAILERDGSACSNCGHAPPGGKDLQVDHIGERNNHDLSNLRTLCRRCHLRRSASQGGKTIAARRARRLRPAQKHPGELT